MKSEKHPNGILEESNDQAHKDLDDLLSDCFFESKEFSNLTATKIYSKKLDKQRFVFTFNDGDIQRTGWMTKEETYNLFKKMLGLVETQ